MSDPATPGESTPPDQNAGTPRPPIPGPPPLPPRIPAPPAIPPYAVGYPAAPGAPPAAYAAPQYASQAQPAAPVYSPGYPPAGQGYAQPSFAPPPGYARPPQGYGPYVPAPPVARPRGGSGLGSAALWLAVIAAVGATILGSIAAYNIGLGTAREFVLRPQSIDFDWSILTPVREWVLIGELAFWGGTVLGTWGLVQGIVATVKNRGRGWGIAAIIVALLGPIIFAIGVQGFITAGLATGASIGG